jgi:hypothetical protein
MKHKSGYENKGKVKLPKILTEEQMEWLLESLVEVSTNKRKERFISRQDYRIFSKKFKRPAGFKHERLILEEEDE